MENIHHYAIALLFVLPVFGLAVRQLAYYLTYATLFEGLREYIAETAEARGDGSFFVAIENVLECPLCLTGQISLCLSIFFTCGALFLTGIATKIGVVSLILVFLFCVAVLTLSIAAISMVIWEFAEFPKRRQIETKRHHEEMIDLYGAFFADMLGVFAKDKKDIVDHSEPEKKS